MFNKPATASLPMHYDRQPVEGNGVCVEAV